MIRRFILIFMIYFSAHAGAAEEKAVQHALLATYKSEYFGIEKRVNELIELYVPKEVKKTAEQLAPLVQAVVSQRVEYKWTF